MDETKKTFYSNIISPNRKQGDMNIQLSISGKQFFNFNDNLYQAITSNTYLLSIFDKFKHYISNNYNVRILGNNYC